MLCVAEGRVFPPNVMYSVRSLFPHNAMLHVFGPYSSAVRLSALCLAHGIEEGSEDVSLNRLLRHVVSGQCSLRFCRDRYAGCVELAGSYEDPDTLRADFLLAVRPVLGELPHSVLQHLAVVLGLSEYPASVVDVVDALLALEGNPPADMLTDLTTVLEDLPALPGHALLAIARSHGLRVDDSQRSLLVDTLTAHIATGACARRLCGEGGPACIVVREQMSDAGDMTSSDVDVFQIQLLRHLVKRLKYRGLRSLCRTHDICFDSRDRPGTLRRKLSTYLTNLAKAKNVRRVEARDKRRAAVARDDQARRQSLETVRSTWPSQLTTSAKEELVRAFRKESGSEQLRTFHCASCVASYPDAQKHVVPFDDVPLDCFQCPPDLRPFLHNSVGLPSLRGDYSDIVLYADSVAFHCGRPVSIDVCADCASFIRRSKCPPLAVVNLNFLGDVPAELRDLTFIEEQIVALCRAKCTIVHLKDSCERELEQCSDCDNTDRHAPNDQRGFKGHIIVYPQRPDEVVNLLPLSLQDISSPVCVIFVGSKAPTLEWLRKRAKPLLVRRERVRAALYWLKAHNDLYANLEISESRLATLPENDLLPVHVEHVSPSAAQDVLTSRYDLASSDNDEQDVELPPSARTIERMESEFSKVVVTDVDGRAPANELRAAALRHVKEKGGAYVEIPHGPRPVNEFCNPALFPQIYPCLYPYGLGGFEDDRRQTSLGFQRHVRHLLELKDSRFREHHSFMFTAFNILQRRAVLLHSSLKVRKSRFAAVAADYASVSDDAVARVCARIAGTRRIQAEDDEERRVLKLMNDVQLVTRQVPGSSGARIAMRNEVRALMFSKGMPSFFITINPADVYNPLVKFFAGADIDVDKLLPGEEPDYWDQSILVARNPVLAARFFHTYMAAFVKTLLKWDDALPFPQEGVLGVVKAYYGCIEAQGRGTLHCHMLVWVEGSLSPTALQHRLKDTDGPQFGDKLLRYLDDLIRTSLPPVPSGFRPPEKPTKRPLTHRGFPLELTPEEAERFRAVDLYELVAACQRHSHSDTCYKYCKKNDPHKICRFQLDADNTVPRSSFDRSTGIVVLQHLDGMVNNYNPTVIEAMRCNMDLKFVGSGDDAKALIFYITDYVTKSPLKAHVSYSALEHAMKKFHSSENPGTNTAEIAKRLLRKCAFSLTSNQELSAPQVASYLLGHSDNYTSHQYANLYWPSFERYVESQLPSPECTVDCERGVSDDGVRTACESDGTSDEPQSEDAIDDDGTETELPEFDDEDDVAVATNRSGNLVMLGGQLSDYICRGVRLEDVSLWDFVAQCAKIARSSTRSVVPADSDAGKDRICLEAARAHNLDHVPFLPSHPESASKLTKVFRVTDRRIPVPIGPRLPRRDRENEWDKYCRLMLILFKPWRSATDLRADSPSWPAAYRDEFEHFPSEVREVLDNMQLLHECRDSRDEDMKHKDSRIRAFRDRIRANREQTDRRCSDNADADSPDEADLLEHLDMISSTRSHHRQLNLQRTIECVATLDDSGFYDHCGSDDVSFEGINPSNTVCVDDSDRAVEAAWHSEYNTRRKRWKQLLVPSTELEGPSEADGADDWLSSGIRDQSTLADEPLPPRIRQSVFDPVVIDVNIDEHVRQWNLNKEQAHAFRLIAEHSTHPLADALRMYIGGAGGTGKSRVIQALTSYFAACNQQRRLRIASFTGIAALHIKGVTLHSALALDQRKSDGPSSRTRRDLQAMWEGVDYLFIDEVSMIGCRFLAQISEALADAKSITDRPFGGISVILAGDFAQLPPVGETRLYAWVNSSNTAAAARPSAQQVVMGKLLWLTFTSVIILVESMRQQGPENLAFVSLLTRLRSGECTRDDFDLLNSRLLSNVTDRSKLRPWGDAPVIVSDNATKDAINEQAACAFATNTGRELHWYYAKDRYRGKPLEDESVLTRLREMPSSQTAHRPGKIPLVLGMPVIISQNFDVAGGVVNGSIGTVCKIRYTTDGQSGHRHLTSCVVRLSDSTAAEMPGLGNEEFPVLEDTVKMTFKHPYTDKRLTVSRTQVPIQPAFSLTVHKAQGQTFRRVVIDLQGCTGTEAPYVMLSRATSLEGVLILREFDEKKICCRPSEDLRKENRRLRRFQHETWLDSGTTDDRARAREVLLTDYGGVRLREQSDSILATMREDAEGTLRRVQHLFHDKRPYVEEILDGTARSKKRRVA